MKEITVKIAGELDELNSAEVGWRRVSTNWNEVSTVNDFISQHVMRAAVDTWAETRIWIERDFWDGKYKR